jgi:hypothetical protein
LNLIVVGLLLATRAVIEDNTSELDSAAAKDFVLSSSSSSYTLSSIHKGSF